MAKDIEEFLRRAAERRRQQQSGQQPAAQPSKPKAKPQPPRQRSIQRKPLQSQEPIVIDEVEVVQPTNLRRQSVKDHVRQHLDTSDISRQTERLGKGISNVSSTVDARVHEHLDHDLSKIDDRPTVTDDPPPAIFGAEQGKIAKQLRAHLSNPKSVGQAILIAEILKRPEFD